MGINLSHLPFYDLCHSQHALQSPLFVLGSQEIHEPPEVIREFARQSGHLNLMHNLNVRSLFSDRYGIGDYRDCDLNTKADLAVDFGMPLPASFVNSAMTVLDSGTIEHIFNVGQAFRNLHALTRTGGVIIHAAPLTWHEHGYYNFNPRLFRDISNANRYTLVAEAFHFVHDPFASQDDDRARLYISFDGISFTACREKIGILLASEMAPARVLYMSAYRKMNEKEFVLPYDVQE